MFAYRSIFLLSGLLIFSAGIKSLKAQSNYELLFVTGRYDSLLAKTEKLETADDYLWRSIVFKKQGYSNLSANILQGGSALYKENTTLEKELARALFDIGNYAQAKGLIQKFIHEPDFFLMYISILEFEDNHIDAIPMLFERLQTDSSNIEYVIRLANNLFQIDSLEAASSWYERALSLNPDDQVTMGKLANVYLILKLYNQSIEICDQALKIDSTNRRFIRIKGLANFRKGKFAEASEAFSYLLEKGDSSLVVLKHLGISESKSYAYHDSRKHLLHAYIKDSSDHEVCFFLGRGFLNSTEPEKGLFFLNKAEELINPEPEVLSAIYTEKVSIYNHLKMYDEVLDLYLRAHKINPRPDYLFYLGSLYEHRFNEKKMALDYYQRFLQDIPQRDTPYPPTHSGQQSLSMKNIAEEKVVTLKEELFFQGKLDKNEN